MIRAVCETCGRDDGTLVEGMCPTCRARYVNAPPPLTAERVLQVLSWHVGVDNGVPMNGLADLCYGQAVPEPERPAAARYIRGLVETLREQGHPICAHPGDGYFLAANDAELNATCEFLYSRAMSSLKKVAAMKRVPLPDLRSQVGL